MPRRRSSAGPMAKPGSAPLSGAPRYEQYEQQGSRNPLVRALMARFYRDLDELVDRASPSSVLEVGAGGGRVARHVAASRDLEVVVAADVDRALIAHYREATPPVPFQVADIAALPYADQAFDLVLAIEVLEHLPLPEAALREILRVGCQAIVSVPREPLWRLLNLVRLAYLRDRGNTPGHIQHWSVAGFVELLRPHMQVREVRTPLPWTMVLGEGPRGAAGGLGPVGASWDAG